MERRSVCAFCLMAFFGFGVAAFATSIPITGSFQDDYPNGNSVDISGPSFSLTGYSFDGCEVGGCVPGDTCTLGAEIEFFLAPVDDAIATANGMTGVVLDGGILVSGTFTTPVFDPNTWYENDPGNPADGYFTRVDIGPQAFSGSMDIWSCDATGTFYPQYADGVPCGPVNYDLFSIAMQGTVDADILIEQGGFIPDGTFNILNGTATVTSMADPAPEPATLPLVFSGLTAILLLSWRIRVVQTSRLL